MKDKRAKILSNKNIGPAYFKMSLEASQIARDAKPGQFVQVRCSDSLDPLLRRPFSIHRITNEERRTTNIEILYEIVGKGTEILSKKDKGEFLDVLGPLGNGFALPRITNDERRTTIFIAGGIGVAPLVFLTEALSREKIKPIVLIGAKTKKLVLCEKDFKNMGAEVHIATDDGTRGYKGFVSNLFKKFLRTTNHERRTTTYACGPQPMLRHVADICKEHKIKCQVSLEENMACGIGACLGCAVRVKDKRIGYKLACKDGPVFDIDEIIL